MKFGIKDVQERLKLLGAQKSFDREFIFDLLLAYGRSPSNVSRLKSSKSSSLNVAENPEIEVAQKGIVYFREVPSGSDEDLLQEIESLSASDVVKRYSTRFIIVTDYRQLLAKDTKTKENLIAEISAIADHFSFFLPWAGIEKSQYAVESHADVKAAQKMAKLFEELATVNPSLSENMAGRHILNIFFTRLLFCFFAEDTGVFRAGQFTEAVTQFSQNDGSDVSDLLEEVFKALDTKEPDGKPTHLREFPYVNGRLFRWDEKDEIPTFNKRARDLLIESGKLNWSEINPDIFGSMFQAIVTPSHRASLSQHYTSVPTILKTIEPLFLDELKSDFDRFFDDAKKLQGLLNRVGKIKIFDPACGSGNFLVIAYKELRKLEHAILERLGEITGSRYGLFDSVVRIEDFFGIELDDFAAEIAVLSLWIAKHQMNIEFEEKFGAHISLIPLTENGSIRKGNANQVDWNSVCPNDGSSEIYLIGNPPYKGSKGQSAEMKADFKDVFKSEPYSKNLDYVALWFAKGARYIRATKAKLAFVTTNSVAQGEHVGLMFPGIFSTGIEIGYCFTSFKWENNAPGQAGVTVAVISLRNKSDAPKYIFSENFRVAAKNINGYLADADDVYLVRKTSPLSAQMPPMVFGNMPLDGGNLLLSLQEHKNLIQSAPDAKRFVRKLYGGTEFIQGQPRYCLWLNREDLDEALSIPEIAKRIDAVREFRSRSSDSSTQSKSVTPWQFREQRVAKSHSLLVPATSSENREYIPMGFLPAESIVSNAAYTILDAEMWVFGLLTSRIHMAWARAVGGKLKTDFRYSNLIVYNNFPVANLTEETRGQLETLASRVLDVREYYSESNLADLYASEKMPENLSRAHKELDNYVDSLYRDKDFYGDEERLATLFELYSSKTVGEKLI